MSGGPRGSYAKGRERREQIVEAAREAFAANGYRGTTIAHIAERTGLTDAGVLHHFASKEELLLTVLERRDAQGRQRVASAAAATGSFMGALLALCEENAASPGMIRLFTVMAAESIDRAHPGHALFHARYARLRRTCAGELRVAQERGEVDPGIDPDVVAPQILAMFDGLQLQWLLDPGEVDMVAVMRDFLARLQRPAPA
jgi:AcrR family transcriptional regulator